MFKNMLTRSILLLLMFFISMNASATLFWATGKIDRTLADTSYGGCMVHLDVIIANGCPANGWVSLDCKNTYYPAGEGDRKFNTALAAAIAGKTVSVYINNTQKHDGYCVAKRIDIII